MPQNGRGRLPAVEAVLFDLDGTLLDSFEQYRRGVIAALNDFGFARPTSVRIRETRGLPGREVVVVLGVPVTDAPAVHQRWVEHARHLAHLSRPFPGVASLLQKLRVAGCRLAIVTSRPRASIEGTPSAMELVSYVDALVTREDTELGKPQPDPVLHALQLLETHPAKAVFVGDASYDMDAGKRAGCTTVLAAWDETRMRAPGDFAPDYVVSSVEELGGLLLDRAAKAEDS